MDISTVYFNIDNPYIIHLSISWIKYCHFSFIEDIIEVEEFDAMGLDVQKIVFLGKTPLPIRQSSKYPPSCAFFSWK